MCILKSRGSELRVIKTITFDLCVLGEKLIQLASDSLVTEILIHPQVSTLKQCMRNLLASFTRHRHIVHAGYTLSGTGSWILQVRAVNRTMRSSGHKLMSSRSVSLTMVLLVGFHLIRVRFTVCSQFDGEIF